MKKKTVEIVLIGVTAVIIAVMVLAAVFASGALTSSKTVDSTGIIATANIGIYSDSACTQSLASINWGTISPGNSATRIIYVKNLGTTQMMLGMSGENWTPANANGPIAVTWNRENIAIVPNQVISATLTLSASSSISAITSFSLDIVITGIG